MALAFTTFRPFPMNVQYIADKSRFIVKAIGDFDFSKISVAEEFLLPESTGDSDMMECGRKVVDSVNKGEPDEPASTVGLSASDIDAFKPQVVNRNGQYPKTSWVG